VAAVTSKTIHREAFAKINVFLRVLSSRDDGYHDLESLVLPISWSDAVTVRPDERLRVEVRGAPAMSGETPAGGMNLALVAALGLADVCSKAGGALIEIEKRIPLAAGLGGGSADAAATIHALNELWGCRHDPATLTRVAERVGSDVPAMLLGGPVLMSGRGEFLAPAEVATFWWVVVQHGFGVRSPDAYRWWDETGAEPGPDPEPALDAAAAGDAKGLGAAMFNDLEAAVTKRHPQIQTTKDELLQRGALGAVMTGSGSSVVGLASDRAHAEELAAAVPNAVVASGPPSPAG
jgi:4-diphosphocytidyl-2-C-methyl-D-erythritol kinase